jgi:NAD(P)-dependent dehydrogenase (short-subunit alcohol dehydrogenase family)
VPLLHNASAPRVVTVASIMGCIGEPQADWKQALLSNHTTRAIVDYSNSKLANALFARALAVRYPNITSVAVNPGFTWTSLLGNHYIVKPVLTFLGTFVIKSVREGAMTTFIAATEDGVVSGGYYSGCALCLTVSVLRVCPHLSSRRLSTAPHLAGHRAAGR